MLVLPLLGWILIYWQYSQLNLSFRFNYYVWSFHFKSGAEEINWGTVGYNAQMIAARVKLRATYSSIKLVLLELSRTGYLCNEQ